MSEDNNTLREGIKQRYKAYHLLDRDRFPDFAYNTNRANYEPLRASFEHELYVVRGMDRTNSTLHIPSTNTLALLFTDDSYVPGRKIRNTCWLYVKNPAETISHEVPGQTPVKHPVIQNFAFSHWIRSRSGFLVLTVALAVGYGIYRLTTATKPRPHASGLTMSRPTPNEVVPREIFAEGKVANADTVWVLVGSATGGYWVQRPIVVNSDGTWKGPILIGHFTNLDTGIRFQLRAMVHPLKPFTIEEYFRPWPEAELSTHVVEVVKGQGVKPQKIVMRQRF